MLAKDENLGSPEINKAFGNLYIKTRVSCFEATLSQIGRSITFSRLAQARPKHAQNKKVIPATRFCATRSPK